jgi:hypothetical protein
MAESVLGNSSYNVLWSQKAKEAIKKMLTAAPSFVER